MSAPMTPDREQKIRMSRTHCEAGRFETEGERPLHVWGPSQYPTQEMCQRCTAMRAWAEDTDADDVVLLAEVDRLRLALASAQRGRRELRARVTELEALRPARFQDCPKCGADYEYGQPCPSCEFKKLMAADPAKATRDLPLMTADEWNAQYPVGTPVTAYPGCRPEDAPTCTQLVTHTRTAASVLGGHTAVVWVDGHSSCISLTHVDPRPGGAS
ncbi:hypothetical protein AB0K57_05025 [Streptomyces halstedii]|uniref:hypothetical protein n=1 Tax=Streptomyces halstedii TaxID=1944 RepID=UPI00345F8C0D